MSVAAPSRGAPSPAVAASVSGLSLSWFGWALIFLIGAGLWLLLDPGMLLADHAAPLTVAWVHACILGFLASVTFGAAYQLLPVAVGEPLWSLRLPWLHQALHVLGVPYLVCALARGAYDQAAFAGAVLLSGFLLFSLNCLATFNRAKTKDVVGIAFALSAVWLVLTALAGILAAVNRQSAFLPVPVLAWLRLHAHIGMAGFFITMIQGAAFRLLPMFTLGDVRDWGRVALGLSLSQGGLVGLAFCWVENLEAGRVAFSLLLTAGIAVSAREALAVIKSRRRRLLDEGLQSFIAGGVCLLLSLVFGLLLHSTELLDGLAAGRSTVLYGVLLIGGALLPMVCGMLFKIVPFLVWMRAYAPLIGRTRVPLAAELSSPRLEQAWLECHLGALVLLALGLARPEPFWLPLAAAVLLASQLLLALVLGRAALHLRRRPQV